MIYFSFFYDAKCLLLLLFNVVVVIVVVFLGKFSFVREVICVIFTRQRGGRCWLSKFSTATPKLPSLFIKSVVVDANSVPATWGSTRSNCHPQVTVNGGPGRRIKIHDFNSCHRWWWRLQHVSLPMDHGRDLFFSTFLGKLLYKPMTWEISFP